MQGKPRARGLRSYRVGLEWSTYGSYLVFIVKATKTHRLIQRKRCKEELLLVKHVSENPNKVLS